MQLELDIFTPYHRLLDLVTDANDTNDCAVENPALWFAFCRLNKRPYTETTVWTQHDIAVWANHKIRAMRVLEGQD